MASALLALAACAHAPRAAVPDAQLRCNEGSQRACLDEANWALAHGDKATAADRFDTACELGSHDSCVHAGRLRLELGDLDRAEPPLVEAVNQKLPGGYYGLADLAQTRGDWLTAKRLRWEALSIEHPDAEIVASWRLGTPAWEGRFERPQYLASALVLDARVQPMAFYGRRVAIGAQTSFSPDGIELMYLMGYQHFFTEWLVLHADALGGARFPSDRSGATYDFGVQAGLKLAWAPVGHINLGVGSTVGSPLHFQVGVGLDWLLALAVAAAAL